MKILLASADVDDIRWAADAGLLDGVLTTPALLGAADGPSEHELLDAICRTAGTPVYVSVHAVDAAEIYRDGRELARLSDAIVVQVPLVEDAIGAIRRLRSDGVRVAATLVFNAAQAILAAKAGALSVVTPIDHLDAVGHSGVQVVRDLRAVFDASATECDVIAVRPATATQFTDCALAGADGVAVRADVLRNLLLHPLTDRGLDRFLRDLSQQHRQWTPA
jgi:transaldolase